jgi:hypothetical protein
MTTFLPPPPPRRVLPWSPLLQMLATLAADPLASLVDTAFVGRLGECPAALLLCGVWAKQ